MLIVFDETTVLSVDKIMSLLIKSTPVKEKTLVSSGFLGLNPKYDEVEIPSWTLEFKYTKPDDTKNNYWTFTSQSKDYNNLKKMAKEIIQQIKSFDASLINAAFESAFLKE